MPLAGEGKDDVAHLLVRVHVPMGLDHILERIGAVDHHPKFARLDQIAVAAWQVLFLLLGVAVRAEAAAGATTDGGR